MATVADELAIAALSDELRETLRRLCADGTIYHVLSVGREDDDIGCEHCAFHALGQDDEHEGKLIEAFQLGWARAVDAMQLPDDTAHDEVARKTLTAEGIL